MFVDLFFAVLAALLVMQVINYAAVLIWWHWPFDKENDDA